MKRRLFLLALSCGLLTLEAQTFSAGSNAKFYSGASNCGTSVTPCGPTGSLNVNNNDLLVATLSVGSTACSAVTISVPTDSAGAVTFTQIGSPITGVVNSQCYARFWAKNTTSASADTFSVVIGSATKPFVSLIIDQYTGGGINPTIDTSCTNAPNTTSGSNSCTENVTTGDVVSAGAAYSINSVNTTFSAGGTLACPNSTACTANGQTTAGAFTPAFTEYQLVGSTASSQTVGFTNTPNSGQIMSADSFKPGTPATVKGFPVVAEMLDRSLDILAYAPPIN